MAEGPTEEAGDERLAAEYPTLRNFFQTVLWPGADGDNLLELLHRVMRHWHPQFVSALVTELDHVSRDGTFTVAELVGYFSRGVPADRVFIDAGNCRPALRVVAGFVRYLHDEDGVRGEAG